MLHAGMTTLLAQRQSSGSMQQGPGVWSGSLSEAFWPPAHGIRRCAAGTREYLRCAKHHLHTFFQPLPMPRTQHFYLHAGLNVVAGYFVVVPIWGCWPPVHLSKYRVASHHSHIAPLTDGSKGICRITCRCILCQTGRCEAEAKRSSSSVV